MPASAIRPLQRTAAHPEKRPIITALGHLSTLCNGRRRENVSTHTVHLQLPNCHVESGVYKRRSQVSFQQRLPSFIAAVARPDITIPICSTSQNAVPVKGPTCSDHFHPGSYVARPIVISPTLTISNFPFSKIRVSSGASNRFKITSSISPLKIDQSNRSFTSKYWTFKAKDQSFLARIAIDVEM